MHNWIQIYLEEKKNHFDYTGFITPKRVPGVRNYQLPDSDQQLITIQFEWNGFLKNVSSSFIGTN
jgi:poly(U)-specific endoribonuclease